MVRVRFITHPQVLVVPSVPVPRWGLSELGRARARAMLSQPWVASIGRVVSSTETKAVEAAAFLAAHLGCTVECRPELGENDRSSTGFAIAARFEQLANAFFAHPGRSVEGWETATAAQARVVAACRDLLVDDDGAPDVAVVAHGAVGTLLYCHLAGLAIDRRFDQTGQGHYFTMDCSTGRPTHHWRPIDEMERI